MQLFVQLHGKKLVYTIRTAQKMQFREFKINDNISELLLIVRNDIRQSIINFVNKVVLTVITTATWNTKNNN